MFKLTAAGPVGSDCTGPYNVSLNDTYSVGDFINDILRQQEWGYIGIYDSKSVFGDPYCEYRGDRLLSNMPAEYLKRKIKRAKASGGWSRMDYLIWLEDSNG